MHECSQVTCTANCSCKLQLVTTHIYQLPKTAAYLLCLTVTFVALEVARLHHGILMLH